MITMRKQKSASTTRKKMYGTREPPMDSNMCLTLLKIICRDNLIRLAVQIREGNLMDRIIFTKGKQREMLLDFISGSHKTQLAAAKQLVVPRSSLRNWVNEKRTLPADIFKKILRNRHDLSRFSNYVQEVRDGNWGRKKGGQNCYLVIRKKYGEDELDRRRQAGGRSSIKQKLNLINARLPRADDSRVLELLGALIGDGWIGISGGRRQVCYCGNISQQAYAKHLQKLLLQAFQIRGYLKLREKFSVFYIIVNSGPIFDFFRTRFDFPVGQKEKFNTDLLPSDWDKAKNVIRGIFDTDGGTYFDKAAGYARPYLVIDITSHNPELLDWISKTLSEKGFKVISLKYSIRLKTISQVERWFNEVKPSNGVHVQKWNRWKSQYMGP